MDGEGDIRINLNGVDLPNDEIYRMIPDEELGRIGVMEMHVQKMQDWAREGLKRTILQYDQQLARKDLAPEHALRLIESKTRALSVLSENTARMQMVLDREKSRRIEKLKSSTRIREAAAKMLETNRKAAKFNDVWNPEPVTQPKVRMFVPGAKFKPTIRVQAREDHEHWPVPP